jgi:hypothetical protein
MDKDTGELLNYRQLTNSLKYKKAWSLSSANKFVQLANGIGGFIKNPTNTIEFIFVLSVKHCRRRTKTKSGASSVSGGNTLDKTLCLKITSLALGKQMRLQPTGQEMCIA